LRFLIRDRAGQFTGAFDAVLSSAGDRGREDPAAEPARLVRHARARVLKIARTWPWKDAFLICWQRPCALPAPA
jgi:hypothetical protein